MAAGYGPCNLEHVCDQQGSSSETIRKIVSEKLFSVIFSLPYYFFLFDSNWISALTGASVTAARQAGGEMTLQGENQKQLHLGHIGFWVVFFFLQVAQKKKKRGRMMQTSAPRSLRENQRPPGRAAELNYRENTVAKGSREGCGIDLSHGGGGGGCAEAREGARVGEE